MTIILHKCNIKVYKMANIKKYMIVDFIEIKEKLHTITNILLREEIKRRAPFIGSIGSRYLHEGDKHMVGTVEQDKSELEMKRGKSSFYLSREEMSKITFLEIVEKIKESAEEMAGQMERGAFQTLTEEMEKHNRNIPGNPPFSPEAFLKGLEMIDIDFADDDPQKPHLPTLVMHPDLAQKAKEQEESMTPEEKARFDEEMKKIIEKKYQDFMKREGGRKIID